MFGAVYPGQMYPAGYPVDAEAPVEIPIYAGAGEVLSTILSASRTSASVSASRTSAAVTASRTSSTLSGSRLFTVITDSEVDL